MIWVAITVFAAVMQGGRSGLQKHLSANADKTTANAARYIFGPPLLIFILVAEAGGLWSNMAWSPIFWLYCVLVAVFQILGTLFMLMVFSRKNFLIGVSFARSEALLVALWGMIFFSEPLSWQGTLAVLGGVIGVFLVADIQAVFKNKKSWSITENGGTLALGLASGGAFALTAWFVRLANQALEGSPFETAITTLALCNSIQLVMLLGYTAVRGQMRNFLEKVRKNRALVLWVGISSVLGSWGWFTAYALMHPAYVKTVGQVEMIVALVISQRLFKESLSVVEFCGIGLIVLSIVMLLL